MYSEKDLIFTLIWYICRLNNKRREDAESRRGTTDSQPAQ